MSSGKSSRGGRPVGWRHDSRAIWLWLLLPALGGCATLVPSELASVVNRSVSGADLIHDPDRHRGETIVVGGEILLVQSVAGESEVEVLERPLEFEEPVLTERSAGRFLIRHTGFLDPAEYSAGLRVTVVGRVAGAVERRLGDGDYRYPVVESKQLKLWPLETAVTRRYPYPAYRYDPYWGPFWYRDPFWDPFWHRFRRFPR